MCGRDANRPSGVGPERCRAESSNHGRRGASGRPASNAVEIPRIVYRTKVRDDGGSAIGKLVHVELAEDDGSGPLEPGHYLGVFVRNTIGKHSAPGGRPHPRRVDVVLEGDRDAVQWAPPTTEGQLLLECPRARQRGVFSERDEGVDAFIKPVDSVDICFYHIHRRQRAGAHERGGVGDTEGGRITRLRHRVAAQSECGGCHSCHDKLSSVHAGSGHDTSFLLSAPVSYHRRSLAIRA